MSIRRLVPVVFLRAVLVRALVMLAVSGVGCAVAADDYPTRPIHLVVPFAAGGNVDIAARIVADGLSTQLKQTVVVDDKPGANAMIGADFVARAAPDGYTLLYATAETHAINPHIHHKVAYDPLKDFESVGIVGNFPFALVISASLPATTLKAFVDYAKRNPGKLSYASWGVGSTSQIAFEQFKQTAGFDALHVPFNGASPAITAVAGGQVDAFIVPLTVAVPQARSGRVRLLGITTAQRSPSAPDVPTFAEQGFPVVIGGWHLIAAPKAVPRPIVDRLNAALNAVTGSAAVRDAFERQGLTPATGSPEDADRMVGAEYQHWGHAAQAAHITVD